MAFIWLTVLLLFTKTCKAEMKFITGQINVSLEETITKFSPKTIQYFLTSTTMPDPWTAKLRVEISTNSVATFHDPLLVVIQQHDITNALELPFSFDDEPNNNSVVYRSVAATLCFNTRRHKEGYNNISITLRTNNKNQLITHVKLSAPRNLYLPLLEEHTVEVSPTHPTYLRFEFNEPDLKTVLLKANSTNSYCMTLSIQTPFCPVFDMESNVRYQGLWQTMSTQAATTIQKEGQFTTGFFVVLVVNKNDAHCGDYSLPHPESERKKNVTLFLQPVRSLQNWVHFSLAVFLPVIIGLIIGIVVYFTIFIFGIFIKREMLQIADNLGYAKSLALQKRIEGTKSENDITLPIASFSLVELGKHYSHSDSGLLDIKNTRLTANHPCELNPESPLVIKHHNSNEGDEVTLMEFSVDDQNSCKLEGTVPSKHGTLISSNTLRREKKFSFISKSFQDTLNKIFEESEVENSTSNFAHQGECQISKDSYEMVNLDQTDTIGINEAPRMPTTCAGEVELNKKMSERNKLFTPGRNIRTLRGTIAALRSRTSLKRFSKEIDIASLIKLQQPKKESTTRLKRYLWISVTVAIFYAVPVYQLIIQYLMLYRSGNYDICYYNFLCAIPLWVFVDFNHMCSNFNYIIFGIVFIGIVRKKRSIRKEIVDKVTETILRNFCLYPDEDFSKQWQINDTIEDRKEEMIKIKIKTFVENHGVPAHYEFYYTLAFVLIMEGFMSAAYHICPNQSTFQFDTCFMYIIAVMGILKVYQMRHPIYLAPTQVFLLMSLFQLFIVVCLTVEQYRVSIMVHLLKGMFTCAHVLWNGYFWIHCYADGYITKHDEADCDWKLIFKQLWPIFLNAHPTRLISPLLMIASHTFIIKEHYFDDFANYLLFLLLGTFIGHTLCYIIRKLIYAELKWWALCQSLIYFILLATVGPLSLKYFHAKLTQWDKTSAQSRAGNRECDFYEFYPFYDQHDVWHFLSAGAVFFYYMFLLTLDDGIASVHQSLIPVF